MDNIMFELENQEEEEMRTLATFLEVMACKNR
jgi:hypothetical protein